jgi:hypothetical protein
MTLLLVSQRLAYDSKAEIVILKHFFKSLLIVSGFKISLE